jgi:hypothetical protein
MKTIMTTKTETTMKNLGKLMMIACVVLTGSNGLTLASGKGTSGAQFLRIGAGARGPAMGGAFSPVADDATAIYWNPAGMARMDKREVALSYNAYFKDTAAQFLGYGHPTDHGTFGLGVSMFGVKNIEKRSDVAGDADTPDLGTFNTRDMALALGYANKMAENRLRYGASLKYINSNLNTKSAATAALDMGLLYSLMDEDRMIASLAVLNLGGTLKFDAESDPLPLDIKPGLAYNMKFERMGKLTMALDSDMYVHDQIVTVQPGLEWSVHPMVALRGGYQFGRSTGAGSGMGAGIGLRLSGFNLDYAFVPYGDLGDTHRVSIGFKF